jgi:hypothetical protein
MFMRSQNPTMVLDASSSSERSLLKYLSRSGKKRAVSIDSTVPSIDESLDYSTTSSNVQPVKPSQQGVYSRAANFIRRRHASSASTSLHRTMVVIEDDDGSDCESARLSERMDDRFFKTLNECEPSQLEQLREYRAEVAPIVCYESDDNDDAVKEQSVALNSRLEALEVQQRLLGKDHPDVVFMTQRIRRLQRRGHFESKSGPRSSLTPFYFQHQAMQ